MSVSKFPQNPRVVAYLRVSSLQQEFRSQAAEVRAYCERRGWKILKIYSEKRSGANAARRELDALLVDARAGKFDLVVVYKLDRLGRSVAHLHQVIRELSALRIGVIASSQGIDTSEANPVANLQVAMIAAFAEFDREMIRERSAAGLKAARARGVALGRPPVSEAKKTAILAAHAANRFHWGRPPSTRSIAREVGCAPGTVARVLEEAAKKSPRSKSTDSPSTAGAIKKV